MGQGVANLGAAQLILNINETGVSATGNYSSVAWSFYMNCGNGSSWNSDPTSWSANISGVGYSGTYTFDFRSTNSKLIAATSLNVGHAANGTLNSSGSASTGYTGTSAIGGPGSVGASYSGSNIAPQPPTSVRIGTRTNTSLQLLFNGPGSGSSPARYIYQWANNSGFSGATQGPATGSGDNTISGLQPGTNYWVRVLSQNDSGNSGWVTVATSTTVGVPGAPTGVTPSNITPTEMDVAWAAPSNVGGPNGGLTGWQLDYSLDSSFATGVTTITDGGAWGTTTHLSGLLPGNTYYVRVRAESSAGYGANSATLSQTTLPSTPPTIAVAPNVSGKGAVVTLTPPSGVTGVSSWVIKVTDTVTGTTTEYDPTSSPYTVNGLTPGRLYSYIAAAVIGAYTSPFSAPVTATQPSPSTAPGSYWDGAKADTADQDYGWAGSADVSVSTAKGKGVLGWLAAPVSTGSVVLARSTGAPAAAAPQPYGATMTVLADLAATVPSARIGMQGAAPYWSAVQPDTPYNGSIHVNPAKDLTLAAELSWYTAAGALISRSAGGAVRVLDTDDWVRVDVTAKSPSNAAFATVAAVDATTGNVYSWSGTADASPSVKKLWGSASGRTNYCRNPRVKTVTGYQGPNTTGLGIFTDAVTPCFYSQTTTSTTPYVFSAPSDVAAKAGETWVLSAVVEILGDAGANPYSFRAHANTGNVYFANGAQTLYTLTGVLTQRRVTVVCTLNADVAAGDLNFSVVRTGAASGVIIRIGQVIIEKANAFTDYFDGSHIVCNATV